MYFKINLKQKIKFSLWKQKGIIWDGQRKKSIVAEDMKAEKSEQEEKAQSFVLSSPGNPLHAPLTGK